VAAALRPCCSRRTCLARTGRTCQFVFGARTRSLLVGVEDARRRLAKLGGRLHLATDDGSRGRRAP
jgi:hypothetical protein